MRANFLGFWSCCPEKAVSLHIGFEGRGGGEQEREGGTGGGKAANAARDVTGLSDKGGLREACHDLSSSGEGLLKTSSSVAGLRKKNNGGRRRRARNARKGAKARAISSHGWRLTHAGRNHAAGVF